MDEEEVQHRIHQAVYETKLDHIRSLSHMATEVYGAQGRLLDLLRAGKINEAIAILEAGRKVYKERILDR